MPRTGFYLQDSVSLASDISTYNFNLTMISRFVGICEKFDASNLKRFCTQYAKIYHKSIQVS